MSAGKVLAVVGLGAVGLVVAWAGWFGAHFADNGVTIEPKQGRAGETWWIVPYEGSGVLRPVELGQVLSSKQTAGVVAYVVKLSHDVVFEEGRNVRSVRKLG